MAVKKNLPPAREMPMDMDEAVKAAMTSDPSDPIYGKLLERRRARNLTEGQRRKVERDAKRDKFTIEIPTELKQRLDHAQAGLRVPPSDLVNVLIALGLTAIEQGEIDLNEYLYNSRLPRYPYRLYVTVPDDEQA
jgi:hypothetical protein